MKENETRRVQQTLVRPLLYEPWQQTGPIFIIVITINIKTAAAVSFWSDIKQGSPVAAAFFLVLCAQRAGKQALNMLFSLLPLLYEIITEAAEFLWAVMYFFPL